MENDQHPSIIVRLFIVACFFACAVMTLAWFIISITSLISQFTSNDAVIEFDKGSFYMLGAGGFFLIITAGGIIQGLLGKKLTLRLNRLFTRGILGSLILMFGVPQLTHYALASYAQQKNYGVCSDATYRWALYAKFYYTNNDLACSKLVEQKNATKSSSGR